MTRTRTFFLAFAGALAVSLAFWFVLLPRFQPHVFNGAVIQSQTPAPRVDLVTSDGGRASLDDFEEQLVVLYFGYTFCPDVCPTTLSTLKRAMDEMGSKADDVQVIMVSVDPARDTPEILDEYLGFFDERFLGMTGTEAEIASVATVYGVFFQANEGSVETGYLVDHTASLMVVDRDGYLKLILPTEVTVEQIVSDLEYLL